jgi:hypothetical protein
VGRVKLYKVCALYFLSLYFLEREFRIYSSLNLN